MDEREELECTHSCATCGGCGHDHDEMDEMETGILTFVDDEGNDVRFEILDVVTLDEKGYYLQGKVYGEKIFLQYLLDTHRRKINELQKRLQNQE